MWVFIGIWNIWIKSKKIRTNMWKYANFPNIIHFSAPTSSVLLGFYLIQPTSSLVLPSSSLVWLKSILILLSSTAKKKICNTLFSRYDGDENLNLIWNLLSLIHPRPNKNALTSPLVSHFTWSAWIIFMLGWVYFNCGLGSINF